MGTAETENLQRALANLAQATQRPAINPGQISGVVDDGTMMAIQASLGLLTEELPSWMYLGLQAALMAGATTSTAKGYVGQYATQLTVAINTAAVKLKVNPPQGTVMTWAGSPQPGVTTNPGFLATLFAPGWYKTPQGMLMIAIGLFIGYKFFVAPSNKA